MNESVAEVISQEETDAVIRGIHEVTESACMRYARGLITEEDRFSFIAEAVDREIRSFLENKRLHLCVSARDWPGFLAEIRAWEKDGDDRRLQACSWLFSGPATGTDSRQRKEAAVSDKAKVLKLLEACHVPIEYYRPVPEGIKCPDEHQGHFPNEYYIGDEIWEEDGGLARGDYRIGETKTLIDHYGLKTVIRIEQHFTEAEKNRYHDADYEGTGTIEGYTSSRPRPIKVYLNRAGDRIRFLKLLKQNDDYQLSFPLWDAYCRDRSEIREIHDRIIRDLIDENENTRTRRYLAIDIGASSGRHIVGWRENGELKTEEVYRFPNGVREQDGHLTWDIGALLAHVQEGIKQALKKYKRIESISIDTWAVDYVLMRGDEEVLPCYAYRDSRTEAAIPLVHEKIPFSELYRRTGIQFQPFNTIYQLYADKLAGRLEGVTDFLLIPEYLMYKLCGPKSHEYTNATTGGMVSAETGEYDPEIIRALELPEHLFRPLQQPGTAIGGYLGVWVKLCATHDTGSAVEGIPMEGNALYISSGTWSLLGVKTPRPLTDERSEAANWSNEGGVGYNRYQKNIMGLWLVNRLRSELCPEKPWDEITAEAEEKHFDHLVDVNDPVFLAPESMKAAFDSKLPHPPKCAAGYFRCAYRSLAEGYRKAIEEIEQNTGTRYQELYIVGGGAKNAFLNRLTEEATGKKVIALPIEATALGNLKIQMEADKA